MALAFFLAFIPHLNYPYPLHVDEWVHLACSNQIISQATAVGVADPFSGGGSIMNQIYEVGLHLPLAVFGQISGIPLVSVFWYFPAFFFMFTVLSVYILASRQGFGWEAALLTCLVPTTVGVLGPAFVVPLAVALMFLPLSAFLAFNFRTIWSYAALFAFVAYLVTLHGPSAVILVIMLIPYLLLNLKADLKHGAAIALALAIPFLVSLPWTWRMLLPNLTSVLTPHLLKPYVDYPRFIKFWGYPVILLCLLGTFVLTMKGEKKSYGLALGLLGLAFMLAVFYTLHYGVPVLYERGLVPTTLVMSIVAGVGLMAVRKFRLPAQVGAWIRAPLLTRNVGSILCLALIAYILVTAIPVRQNIPYYPVLKHDGRVSGNAIGYARSQPPLNLIKIS